jgi:hypothetical protein
MSRTRFRTTASDDASLSCLRRLSTASLTTPTHCTACGTVIAPFLEVQAYFDWDTHNISYVP